MCHTLLLAAALLVCTQTLPPAPREAAAQESLELRYARARVELARANLRRVEQMNRRLDRTVPASVVDDFKQDLAEAELAFQQASGEPESHPFTLWLRRAESSYRSAETRWKNAVAANKRVADTIPAIDVERFRLRAEVAHLQWQRGQSLIGGTHEQQLAWQVDLLNDEIELLKEETSRVAPFVRYYPIWMY